MTGDLQPHPIAVSDDQLEDLRDRLRRTRWPERETVDDWSQGIPLAYVQELCATWADSYDWRRVEPELNGYEQLRFLPEAGAPGPGRHPGAPRPVAASRTRSRVVFTHGWPGSVVEFLDVIEPLRDPRAARRRSRPTPSTSCARRCPGYGFSDKPTKPGWNVDRIGDAWIELMTALGYDRFGAQGGDWGSAVTTSIGMHHADRCVGIHLNMVSAGPGKDPGELTEAEQASLARMDDHRKWGTGYSTQQSTRPQTLGYGLVDSPAGQAAWIVEKFWAWADHQGHPEDAVSRDAPARQRHALLAARRRRVVGPAVLGELQQLPGRRDDRRAVGHVDLPGRDLQPVAPLGRAPLHRHPPLERARRRRPLRRLRAADDVRRRGPHVLPHRAVA